MRNLWKQIEILKHLQNQEILKSAQKKLEYLQKPQPQGGTTVKYGETYHCGASSQCILGGVSKRLKLAIYWKYILQELLSCQQNRDVPQIANYVFIENLFEYFPRYWRNVYMKVKSDKESFPFLALQVLKFYYFLLILVEYVDLYWNPSGFLLPFS